MPGDLVNLGGPMALLLPAAVVSALPVLTDSYRRRRGVSFGLALAGLGLLLVALGITLTVNVPIDGNIAGWTVATLPSDWMRVRDRWEMYHGARTAASVTGFGCALAASLWVRDGTDTRAG